MATTTCRHCGASISLPKKALKRAGQDGLGAPKLVMIECPECLMATEYRAASESGTTGLEAPSLGLVRCPVSGCTGWVVDISDSRLLPDGSEFGCGYCGSTWESRNLLDSEISLAIDKFNHRRQVYRRSPVGWVGVPLAEEPEDYTRRVESEQRPAKQP
jgi:hypothetical protein